MCFIFHKWSKWEQYTHQYSYHPGRLAPREIRNLEIPANDLRQRRHCLICGAMQDELVAEWVSLSETNKGD